MMDLFYSSTAEPTVAITEATKDTITSGASGLPIWAIVVIIIVIVAAVILIAVSAVGKKKNKDVKDVPKDTDERAKNSNSRLPF